MEELLFNVEPTVKPNEGATCRSCRHRERWECESKVIQYCGKLRSGRTWNGKKKIKVTNAACGYYEKEE